MAVTYKDIDQLTQKSSVAGTEKIVVSDTNYITPTQIAGLVGSSFVDKTSDETIGGDKTFEDNVGVVDADHIVYSGGGSSGFTRGVAVSQTSSTSITFTGLSGEPKAFILSATWDVNAGDTGTVVAVVGDSSGCHGVYNTRSQHNYSSGFTASYSNGSLTVSAPSGTSFNGLFSLVYYYGSGTLTFHTKSVNPGSGVTSLTFTDTLLTGTPTMYAVMLETAVNSESYRRVALYTNSVYDEDETEIFPLGKTFYSQQLVDTSSSFSASYNNGLYINSGGTNAGGYFHNPGTYTLYYLMSSDVGSGGGASYTSLGDELDAIRDTIGDIETALAAI